MDIVVDCLFIVSIATGILQVVHRSERRQCCHKRLKVDPFFRIPVGGEEVKAGMGTQIEDER